MTYEVRRLKLCLMGDGAVGKTSLIHRFVHDRFDEKYKYTLGTSLCKKDVLFEEGPEGPFLANLVIWDIMGQQTLLPRFSRTYFKHADGALAVCDLTRPPSLSSLKDWIGHLEGISPNAHTVILANKSDLAEEIRIGQGDIEAFATPRETPWFLTSAKTGENVEAAFKALTARIVGGASLPRGVSTGRSTGEPMASES